MKGDWGFLIFPFVGDFLQSSGGHQDINAARSYNTVRVHLIHIPIYVLNVFKNHYHCQQNLVTRNTSANHRLAKYNTLR